MAMNRIVIDTDGISLRRLFLADVARLPNYAQKVSIYYTEGKGDPIWRGSDDSSLCGITFRACVWELSKNLDGFVGIDLKCCLASSVQSSLVADRRGIVSTVDMEGFKSIVFRTLAHEYFHVVKAWQGGGTPKSGAGMPQAYVDELQRAARQAILQNPLLWFDQSKLALVAYYNHAEESAAKQIAEGARKNFATELRRGAWDSLFPIAEMQRMVREWQAGAR